MQPSLAWRSASVSRTRIRSSVGSDSPHTIHRTRFRPHAAASRSMNSRRYWITSSASGEQRRRHLDAERPRRLQVDDELELGRLHDRQVGGLGALEDAAGIDADLTKRVCEVGSVAHQPAGCDVLTLRISRRNPVARRQGGKLHAAAVEECVGSDEEGIGALARKGGKGRIDLAGSCWR